MSEEIPIHRYFIIHKPVDMVSQFISPDMVNLLGDLNFDFPEGTHAIGRLDNESEGLLILTTDKRVTRLLFQGEKKHNRTYLVLVKNVVSEETVKQLATGISIRVKGGENYISSPCKASIVTDVSSLYPYASDTREAYPHTWLLLTLTEGKFHQVRKMVLAVRHRCLRLIRVSIENILLGDLKPGEVKELEEDVFFRLLDIDQNSK
ncbi:pseudouridine synthase [uncultured Cytophaga sp.]|uniref:pseudouridine synthase n=1 Tax=uncultured Cytophaga sp. TaxID=160238 RepID=UPI002612248B|nr:pseudouridine synthase [uncultured Cytophaga sp.]